MMLKELAVIRGGGEILMRSTAFLLGIILLCGPNVVRADVPEQLQVQGTIQELNGVAPLDGVYEFGVQIFDAPVGGTLLFSRSSLVASVAAGAFSLSITPALAGDLFGALGDSPRFIEITVDAGPGGQAIGETLLPRQELSSVPYAMLVHSADRSSSADVATFVEASYWKERTGALVDSSGSHAWVTIPNLTVTIDLDQDAEVQLNANGIQRTGVTLCHQGYRFKINENGQGDSTWGQALVASNTATNHFTPWVVSDRVSLPAGQHTLEVQTTRGQNDQCIVCGERPPSSPQLFDYTNCNFEVRVMEPRQKIDFARTEFHNVDAQSPSPFFGDSNFVAAQCGFSGDRWINPIC